MQIRFAVSPRMRKLQTNKQALIGPRRKLVLGNECGTQLCEPSTCMLRDHQLIRIRAAAVRDGNGFAAPD